MKTPSTQLQTSLATLLNAYAQGKLGHNDHGTCAVTHLLKGKLEWLDAINPLNGTIDHAIKLSNPQKFSAGLKVISESPFSIEEIIALEAKFEGRSLDAQGRMISSLDEQNDPDGSMGLVAVLDWFQQVEVPSLLITSQASPSPAQVLA